MQRVCRVVSAVALAATCLVGRASGQTYVEVTPGAAAVTASTSDGNVPANTVDNNLATRWSANGDGQWLQLDLGATRTVGFVKVAVYNGNARQNIFDLQVSSGGGVWSTVFSGQSSGTTTLEQTYDFPDVDARFVRYLGHSATTSTFNSVTEISVFAQQATPTPTATNPSGDVKLTPVSASASTNDGNVPGNAIDGSLATRWSANGDGQWLQLDLGSAQTITTVQIAAYSGNTRRSLFDIQTSNGGAWTTVLLGGSTSGTTTALESFDVLDTNARFIRYLGHGNSTNGWNSVNELEAWGQPCGSCATPTATGTLTATPTPTLTPTPTPRTTALQGKRGSLYTPPTNTFFVTPGDSAVVVNDTTGSIASVQSAIASARSANPGAVIVVNLKAGATYAVGGSGLVLGSKECLVIGSATLQASSAATAAFLVQVASGASNVSIAGGTLDGGGASLNGIVAPSANRVNVDNVTVRNTGLEPILLKGHGSTVFDNELTVTRCRTSGAPGHAGIRIENATQALVIDNDSHDNLTGIALLTSARSSVVNNTTSANATGIELTGSDNVVANNTCDGNGTGIDAGGSNNVVVSNAIGSSSSAGIESQGTSNTFVDNLFTAGNAVKLASGGTTNNVVAYKGVLAAAGQTYFYPPLVSDPHTSPIMNGKGRFDLTIGSTSLASVQSQYDAARSAHPNDVIVLHLTGTYSVGSAPLTLSSNTSVLLTGTIQVGSATTASSVISATNQSGLSLSGGTIDGGGRAGRTGINLSGCRLVQIDAVTVRSFGPSTPRSGGGIVHLAGGATPYILTRNTLSTSSARGVWSQLSGAKAIYTDNAISNHNMDGIDFDSHTNAAVAKFNVLKDNVRAGLFIEEGARWNQCFGNTATGSLGEKADNGNGLWVWANATGPTVQNTYFCNRSEGNKRNLSCGTFDGITTQSTSNNFLFNNILRNGTNGLISQANGVQNYYSQNIVSGNTTNYGSLDSAVFFNSSIVP